MANIAKSLRAQYSRDELYLLNAKRNSGSFTYDGIERGGERLCAEIEAELRVIEDNGGKIKKLSIVGYSLGGLVCRYAVGMLHAKGILDTVECMVCAATRLSCPFTNDDALQELCDFCLSPSRRTISPQRLAQPRMERPGRKDPVHVRPTAVYHR